MMDKQWWKCTYCGHRFYFGNLFKPDTCPKCHRKGVEPLNLIVTK